MRARRQRRRCRVCKIYKTRQRIDILDCWAINLAVFPCVKLSFMETFDDHRCNFFVSIGCKSLDIIHVGISKKLRRLKLCYVLFTYSIDNLHEQLLENEDKNSTKQNTENELNS
ncbi:hypothetical protein WN48_00169 [Eufriesea mexicana]|nr:hypothetical protein WN48_00169 [Eufriesea mexicana]